MAKARPPFQGECHWCRLWGHSATSCHLKYEYMENLRRKGGRKRRGQWKKTPSRKTIKGKSGEARECLPTIGVRALGPLENQRFLTHSPSSAFSEVEEGLDIQTVPFQG